MEEPDVWKVESKKRKVREGRRRAMEVEASGRDSREV